MKTPQSSLKHQLSRRQFIKYSTIATTAAMATAPAFLRGQNLNNKLNIATIGAGGKGASDTDSCKSENIVALCDVDGRRLDERGKAYPNAKLFKDWRKMLEEVKEIDAVIVSGPDHMHAPAASMAMKMGKHAYVQKPLTHSVHEARYLRELAQRQKVATQMGNQGSAESGLRRAVEVIQSGAIGPVRELHVWSNRPIWPQGIERPTETDPVPEHLDWDLWLGPAAERPFKAGAYHPFNWRGWQDFGTGALGDMACHTANMPFRALKLGYPSTIEAETSGMNKETFPRRSKIKFEFPAREGMPPLTFWWYDGGWKPNDDQLTEVRELLEKIPGSGCLMVGDKGKLFSPDDYGARFFLLPEKQFEGYKGPEQSIARSPGHYKEWLDACKGGPAPYSNFDIAGYLTEIILLGCVAMQVGKKLEWDGPNMRAKNAPEAAQYVKREYRKGWTL
jgi:hypothetical protein